MEFFLWSVIPAGLVFFAYVVWDWERKKQKENERAIAEYEEATRRAAKWALIEAERAYASALENLEADNSTENKKRALESGRKYAALSREAHEGDKAVTLFDEVALTNDINARIK